MVVMMLVHGCSTVIASLSDSLAIRSVHDDRVLVIVKLIDASLNCFGLLAKRSDHSFVANLNAFDQLSLEKLNVCDRCDVLTLIYAVSIYHLFETPDDCAMGIAFARIAFRMASVCDRYVSVLVIAFDRYALVTLIAFDRYAL